MYGPGSPPRASKQRQVSSTSTGPLTCEGGAVSQPSVIGTDGQREDATYQLGRAPALVPRHLLHGALHLDQVERLAAHGDAGSRMAATSLSLLWLPVMKFTVGRAAGSGGVAVSAEAMMDVYSV